MLASAFEDHNHLQSYIVRSCESRGKILDCGSHFSRWRQFSCCWDNRDGVRLVGMSLQPWGNMFKAKVKYNRAMEVLGCPCCSARSAFTDKASIDTQAEIIQAHWLEVGPRSVAEMVLELLDQNKCLWGLGHKNFNPFEWQMCFFCTMKATLSSMWFICRG